MSNENTSQRFNQYIDFRLTTKMDQQIETIVNENKVSRSAAVRFLIDRGLDTLESEWVEVVPGVQINPLLISINQASVVE